MAQVTTVHQPRPWQDWGPGHEPESVREAYDDRLRAQAETQAEAEPEAEIG
jgi:hypothetical protein